MQGDLLVHRLISFFTNFVEKGGIDSPRLSSTLIDSHRLSYTLIDSHLLSSTLRFPIHIRSCTPPLHHSTSSMADSAVNKPRSLRQVCRKCAFELISPFWIAAVSIVFICASHIPEVAEEFEAFRLEVANFPCRTSVCSQHNSRQTPLTNFMNCVFLFNLCNFAILKFDFCENNLLKTTSFIELSKNAVFFLFCSFEREYESANDFAVITACVATLLTLNTPNLNKIHFNFCSPHIREALNTLHKLNLAKACLVAIASKRLLDLWVAHSLQSATRLAIFHFKQNGILEIENEVQSNLACLSSLAVFLSLFATCREKTVAYVGICVAGLFTPAKLNQIQTRVELSEKKRRNVNSFSTSLQLDILASFTFGFLILNFVFSDADTRKDSFLNFMTISPLSPEKKHIPRFVILSEGVLFIYSWCSVRNIDNETITSTTKNSLFSSLRTVFSISDVVMTCSFMLSESRLFTKILATSIFILGTGVEVGNVKYFWLKNKHTFAIHASLFTFKVLELGIVLFSKPENPEKSESSHGLWILLKALSLRNLIQANAFPRVERELINDSFYASAIGFAYFSVLSERYMLSHLGLAYMFFLLLSRCVLKK